MRPEGVGSPRHTRGDKLHHKFAVIDNKTMITGSFNWSLSSAHTNDETLLEALATQCFLNEYVYWQSDEKQQWIDDLIEDTKKSKKGFSQSLSMIGCYRPIHSICTKEAINDKGAYCYRRTETNDFSGLRRAGHSEAFVIKTASSTSPINLPND